MKPEVFILSSPRSGSTITRLTLDKLPGIITLPETHFWVFLEQNKSADFKNSLPLIANKWINFYSIKQFPFDHKKVEEEIVQKAIEWRDLLEITINHYLFWKYVGEIPSSLVICEKSPPHIFFQNQIKKMYPNAKFIYLIRDPRDVMASLKTCSWSTSDVYINSKVWRKGIRSQSLTESDKWVMKYEDFVLYPDKVLKELCRFLGITFDAYVINTGNSDVVERNSITSKNSLKPINNNFVGTYSQKLSVPDLEVEIIEYVCRREMKVLGYKPTKFERMNFRLFSYLTTRRINLLVKKIIG